MVTIYERNGWLLKSEGNGARYELRRGEYSVYFQGDDATTFREEVMDVDGFLKDNCEMAFVEYDLAMQHDNDLT